MKAVLSFADRTFRSAQRHNAKTARDVGAFDDVLALGPKDIDAEFRLAHSKILSARRGAGYWLWKPFLLHRTLRMMSAGDWLFYSDAGAYFIRPIDELIEFAIGRNLNVLLFDLVFLERQYTKRDAFVLMECDLPAFSDSRQRLASFSLWRAGDQATSFTAEWLRYSEDIRILTDLPNQLGLPNHPEFIEHRHDQSVMSLLSKKHELPSFRDPSQWGELQTADHPDSTYPQILVHSRTLPLFERLRRSLSLRIRGR